MDIGLWWLRIAGRLKICISEAIVILGQPMKIFF
jgi:hypothetical protein